MYADTKGLCSIVRQTGFDIHCFLRNGHLEKTYENALAHRLRKLNLQVEQQFPVPVHDEDGTLIGSLVADLFVEGRLIVEIKACKRLGDEHVAQLLGYLRGSGFEDGLLLNFGGARFEAKKYILNVALVPSSYFLCFLCLFVAKPFGKIRCYLAGYRSNSLWLN